MLILRVPVCMRVRDGIVSSQYGKLIKTKTTPITIFINDQFNCREIRDAS